jgi:hypothetical protein
MGLLSDDHNGAHELAVAFGVHFHCGRQELGVWVGVLVTECPSGCTNVGGNPLSTHSDPLAADVLVTIPWKLEPPKCSVNAHWTL